MRSLLVLCGALLCLSASAKESPYIDLRGVEGEQRKLFDDISTTRLSPCIDPETLADAFNKEQPCLLAVSYGRLLARLLRSGFSRDHIEKFMDRVEENRKKPVAQIDVTDRPSRGPADAKVVIVEFADYECSYCGRLEPVLQKVLAKHSGAVVHYFLNFPLTQLHPMADAAARAAIAAKKQGKFWEMHDLLYERQEQLDPARFDAWAKELGLNVEQFNKDLTSSEVSAELAADIDQAINTLRIDGTPTLFLNGRRYIEANTEEALDNAILLAYAEATGDASRFLVDPGIAVRTQARAESASFLFWAIAIAQSALIVLLLTIILLRKAKANNNTKPLITLVLAVGVLLPLLGLVAYVVADSYLTERFGPGESWVLPWLKASAVSIVLTVMFSLLINAEREKKA
jgi:protein-disulfide isomerase